MLYLYNLKLPFCKLVINYKMKWASLVAQLEKHPCNEGSLGWEDPLEEGTATHSVILAWRIPWTI